MDTGKLTNEYIAKVLVDEDEENRVKFGSTNGATIYRDILREAAGRLCRAESGRTSDALEDAVRTMRTAQREYFRTRASSALIAAKQAERAVDALLDRIDEDKNTNNNHPKQGELL